MASPAYSVPQETQRVFQNGILNNPLLSTLSPELKDLAVNVSFEGSDNPSIPINWRLAESISALKALEATVLNYLLVRKYGIASAKVKINTSVQKPNQTPINSTFSSDFSESYSVQY